MSFSLIHSFVTRTNSHHRHQSHGWECNGSLVCLASQCGLTVMSSCKYTRTHTNIHKHTPTVRLFSTDASKNSKFPRAPRIEPWARFPRAQKIPEAITFILRRNKLIMILNLQHGHCSRIQQITKRAGSPKWTKTRESVWSGNWINEWIANHCWTLNNTETDRLLTWQHAGLIQDNWDIFPVTSMTKSVPINTQSIRLLWFHWMNEMLIICFNI